MDLKKCAIHENFFKLVKENFQKCDLRDQMFLFKFADSFLPFNHILYLLLREVLTCQSRINLNGYKPLPRQNGNDKIEIIIDDGLDQNMEEIDVKTLLNFDDEIFDISKKIDQKDIYNNIYIKSLRNYGKYLRKNETLSAFEHYNETSDTEENEFSAKNKKRNFANKYKKTNKRKKEETKNRNIYKLYSKSKNSIEVKYELICEDAKSIIGKCTCISDSINDRVTCLHYYLNAQTNNYMFSHLKYRNDIHNRYEDNEEEETNENYIPGLTSENFILISNRKNSLNSCNSINSFVHVKNVINRSEILHQNWTISRKNYEWQIEKRINDIREKILSLSTNIPMFAEEKSGKYGKIIDQFETLKKNSENLKILTFFKKIEKHLKINNLFYSEIDFFRCVEENLTFKRNLLKLNFDPETNYQILGKIFKKKRKQEIKYEDVEASFSSEEEMEYNEQKKEYLEQEEEIEERDEEEDKEEEEEELASSEDDNEKEIAHREKILEVKKVKKQKINKIKMTSNIENLEDFDKLLQGQMFSMFHLNPNFRIQNNRLCTLTHFRTMVDILQECSRNVAIKLIDFIMFNEFDAWYTFTLILEYGINIYLEHSVFPIEQSLYDLVFIQKNPRSVPRGDLISVSLYKAIWLMEPLAYVGDIVQFARSYRKILQILVSTSCCYFIDRKSPPSRSHFEPHSCIFPKATKGVYYSLFSRHRFGHDILCKMPINNTLDAIKFFDIFSRGNRSLWETRKIPYSTIVRDFVECRKNEFKWNDENYEDKFFEYSERPKNDNNIISKNIKEYGQELNKKNYFEQLGKKKVYNNFKKYKNTTINERTEENYEDDDSILEYNFN